MDTEKAIGMIEVGVGLGKGNIKVLLEGTIEVADLPADLPVLVGHMILEYLDLCLDIKKGLIYNPAHGDEWIEDQL